METLETLRRQLDNVQDMQSVVTTMKTLAAVSIRQYEAAVRSLSDYDRTLDLAFRILLRNRELTQPAAGPEQLRIAVVFGSDQGMCGQFNDRIVELADRSMGRSEVPSDRWRLLVVGVRAANRLEDAGWTVDRLHSVPVSVDDITRLVQDILPRIQHWQSERTVGRLVVYFNEHVSASAFEPTSRQLLPLPTEQVRRWQSMNWESNSLPTHTLQWRELFSAVVREYFHVSLFRAAAESLASENASRITSMQAAEKNIDERLSELQTRYHQQRQTAITEELLDVVTGFEALSQDAGR